MNSPEESAVRDLYCFTQNVLNGMLDMHSTAAEFIRYSFSVRTIKDLVRRGSEDPELINQIYDSLNHMVIYLNEEIVEYSRQVTPVGLENRHFNAFFKRIQLMYEVWVAMNVNEAYLVDGLLNHVNASREAVKISYGICKDYPHWKKFTAELRQFFLGEVEEMKPTTDLVEPTLFAREDGVVSSLSHEKAQSDEEGKKKQFVAMTEKVLGNFRANNPDYKTMSELINANVKFRLEGIYCDTIIKEFISIWDTALNYCGSGIQEKYLFTAFLKKVFTLMTEKRRNDFAVALLDKYAADSDDVLPCLENFVENFSTGLTGAINKMPLDSNVLSNNMESFDKVKGELSWYLFASPAYTVQQLLTSCVDNKGYIPLVIRVFRTLPTLFSRNVKVTPLPFEDFRKEKLLFTMLHRVFMLGRTSWESAAQYDTAGSMALSLGKIRKNSDEKPLLDSFSLVNFCLVELIAENRKPLKAVETVVKVLQRVLANNNNARMLTNFRFANSYQLPIDHEMTLPTPVLIELMFQILLEYDGVSSEISEGSREILKSISGRITDDKIVFDADTCNFIIKENFNQASWWIKYSIYTRFSTALQNPRRQVPSGVYKTLPEQYIDNFEQIKSEETSLVKECYLRSLFELGLFDVDLAIDLLKISYETKFGGPNLVEEIGMALVDSFGKKFARKTGGLEIGRLISAMLVAFDPVRELVPLKTYSASYFDCIKQIEHILVLSMAARIAKEKQLCAVRVRTEDIKHTSSDELFSLNEISQQLMDVFCETTKSHVEQQASEITKLREEANSIIFTPGNTEEQWKIMTERDDKEQSFVLQLTMLYLNASHFCRLYQEVPIKLQQLMNVTLDKQFDAQKLLAKKVMDDVLTDQRKTEVVYAFVEPAIEPKSPEKKEVVEPVKRSELYTARRSPSPPPPSQESVSAENAMFNMNNGGFHPKRNSQYRPRHFDHDRPSSSKQSGGGQGRRPTGYRDNRFQPVHDIQAFPPRDRDFVNSAVRNQTLQYRGYNNDRRGEKYDEEKLYFSDRQSPYDRRRSERQSESSWDGRHRQPSESDFSHEESDNRFYDQTVQSMRQFSQRTSYQQHNRAGPSTSSSSQNQEGRQKKGLFNSNGRERLQPNKSYGNKKHRDEIDKDEDRKNRLKRGQPDREEIADALGLNNPPPPPPNRNPRRGGFRH